MDTFSEKFDKVLADYEQEKLREAHKTRVYTVISRVIGVLTFLMYASAFMYGIIHGGMTLSTWFIFIAVFLILGALMALTTERGFQVYWRLIVRQ